MTTTPILIKTSTQVKKKAQLLAKNMGLSLSAVINSFLSQFVRTQEIHISFSEKPNKKTEKLFREVLRDIKAKKNLSKIYTSDNIDEAFESRK